MTALSLAAGLVFMVVAIAATRPDRSRKRRVRLEAKYATSPHLRTIVEGKIVAGMTEAEVVDAWGKPAQRTHQVLKTKTKDVLRFGSGRYASRVTLENGRVVGWTKSG